MKCKIFKIKEGKLQQWKDWCAFLNSHKAEVLGSMKEEGLTQEFSILYDDTVLFYCVVGKSLPSTDKEINRLHKKNRVECLEPVVSDVLFDFKIEEKK